MNKPHDDASSSRPLSDSTEAESTGTESTQPEAVTAKDTDSTEAPSDDLSNITPDGESPIVVEEVDRSVIWARDGKNVAAWSWRLIVTVAAIALVLTILYFAWAGILPVMLAILVSSVLWPVAKLLRRIKFPAALASLSTILGFFALVGAIFAAMAPTIRSQGAELINQAEKGFDEVLTMVEDWGFDISTDQIREFGSNATDFLRNQSGSIASSVVSGVSVASQIVITVVIMFVLTFFFLKDGDRFLPWLRKYSGHNAGWHLTECLTRIWNTLSGFIRTQAVVSFVDAVFIGLGLVVLQVPLAFVLAVITFFAGFIPIVGAISAGGLAVIIALVSNGVTNALLVLALIVLVQQLEGNILQPMLQSRSMGIHAAIVLLAITLGSALAGIIGAFLAVPVAATIAVIFRYHSEMVGLRAGDLSLDDITIVSKDHDDTEQTAFDKVKQLLSKMGGDSDTAKASSSQS